MDNYSIGVDVGSRTCKIVVLHNRDIVHSEIRNTGVNPQKTAEILVSEAKEIVSKIEIPIFSTGYGRKIVKSAQKAVSEISCHALGVNYIFPEAKTIIDIGGQDSKVILINRQGKVLDFIMNDRCAAGTGRFLEVAANILELTVDVLGEISSKSGEKMKINSTCVVFAETEIIGLIAKQKKVADIIAAIHTSIAHRTRSLIAQLAWQEPVIFTGGVALNKGMQNALEKSLNSKLSVPSNPSFTGALGAAILAGKTR